MESRKAILLGGSAVVELLCLDVIENQLPFMYQST